MEVDDIVVVQAGRWILFSSGEWEFKMDSYRQGRALRLMGLKTFRDLELKVRQLYRMERSSVSVELSYMFEDNLALLAGVQPGPTMIRCDRQFRSFKSLSIDDKSVNLFVCFREGDGVIAGPTLEARMSGSCFAKGLEAGDSSAGIVEAGGNSRSTEGVGYFGGLLSAVQDNNTVYPPVQGNNPQLAIAQSTDVIDSSGGWDISDEILLEAVEEVEKASKRDLVVYTGVNTSVAVEDEMESSVDEEYSENSDDSYSYSGGSESEDDDYDYESNTVGRVEAGKEFVVDEDSGDDDFVEQPPKKKVRQKEKGKGIEERTDNLACVGGVMTEFLHIFQKGISIDEVYGYEDIEPMFGDNDMDRKAAHVDLSKEDDNMYVGRTFASREDFRTALSIYAINRVFRFKFTRYEKNYLVAECYDKKCCDWRVLAHQVGQSEEYEVTKAKLEHMCNVETRSRFSKHATSKVVAALLRAKYAKAFCGPRARDLPDSLLRDHNVRMTYWKGWKAKELAVETAQGTDESSFTLLPVYLHVLQVANPGTIYHLETELDEIGDERFKYVFLVLGACLKGLKYLRRVVVVDGTHLFGKYLGCLLTASFQDANFQIYPVAFAIVDSETDESWTWFMNKLSEIIKDGPDLTFVSDRNSSIIKSVGLVYPEAHHGACLVHIRRNVKGKYGRKSGLPALVWQAGNKFRLKEFNIVCERIKKRNKGCWNYLEEIGVSNWSRVHFAGERYNLMSSNIAESLNNALLPARGSPVLALLEFIRKMLGRWFESRRKKISRTVGDIPIAVERELLKRFKGGLGMTVLPVGRWDFEVVAKDGEQFIVSLEQQTCSCLEFQKIRIPCVHAMAAAHDRGLEFRTLVGEMYRLGMWSPTVQESILPVCDPSEVDVPEEIRLLCLMPPKTKRPPGRPPKLRIHSVGEYEGNNKSKQPNKCGRCGGVGHNRVTCTNPIG